MSRYLKTVFDKCWRPICVSVSLWSIGVATGTHLFLNNVGVGHGGSMEPTLLDGDILLTENLSVYLNWIKKGDVIIVEKPCLNIFSDSGDPQLLLCKRIIGMPGDKFLKGSRIVTVPPRHVWLEGDNKKKSTDSRCFGAVPQSLILSRVRVALRISSSNTVEKLLLM